MRGGINCKMNSEKRTCEYPFEPEKVYIDPQDKEYTFDELKTQPQENNANGLCSKYSFITEMDQDTKTRLAINNDVEAKQQIEKNTCNKDEKDFLERLSLK
jgi:hypothetical protein